MKQLTCSKLSSSLRGFSMCMIRWLVIVMMLSGSVSAQAQQKTGSQQEFKPLHSLSNWFKTSELPAEATGVEDNKKEPGWVSSAINRFRNNELPGDLQIHGFVTQAYISTSDNDVFGNSDKGGSFGLTEAALNASARPLPKLQVSAQVLSRRAGEGNTGMPRLDYAFLDYQVYSREADQFGIRVGRLKNPFGFYNDTRDVAFTRPGILLPQSIYFDRTRNLGLSGDSVQLYGEKAISSWGTFSTQFGVFWPIVNDKDTESSVLGSVRTGSLNREASYIGRGIFETNDKRLRLAISGVWLNTSYDPAYHVKDNFGPGTFQFTPIYFSAQYNTEKWSLTSEYAIRHITYNEDFGSKFPFSGRDIIGESYYFQGEYRFTPRWEGFVRYDAYFADRNDRDGSQFAQEFKGVAHTRFARDITVGLRWNVTPEFMLRAEYHHVNGTGWLSRLDNPTTAGTTQNWDLFGILASYRF